FLPRLSRFRTPAVNRPLPPDRKRRRVSRHQRAPDIGVPVGLAAAGRVSRSRAMILVVDNYDSFTWNLVHYLAELGAATRVVRNDELAVDEALALRPEAVLLSPGPCAPDQAGVCLPLLAAAPADLPIFGVCLGHQAIGQAFGGQVVRAMTLMHGKTSPIRHQGRSVFA